MLEPSGISESFRNLQEYSKTHKPCKTKSFKTYYVGKCWNCVNRHVLMLFGKGGYRKIMKIRLIVSKKLECGINIFLEMKRYFGNIGSLKLWNFEISKLGNFETLELWQFWYFSTKKPKIKKPGNQETKKLFQVRDSPLPLNIPTPTHAPDHILGGHEANELVN